MQHIIIILDDYYFKLLALIFLQYYFFPFKLFVGLDGNKRVEHTFYDFMIMGEHAPPNQIINKKRSELVAFCSVKVGETNR